MPTVLDSKISTSDVDHYKIVSQPNGYFLGHKFEDLSNQSASLSKKGEQAHGFKRIVYSTQGSYPIPEFSNEYKHNTTQLRGMTATQVEDYLNSGVDTVAILGDFYPNEGEDILINIDGQHIVKSDLTGYYIQMYDLDFANLLSQIIFDKATGNITMSGATTQEFTMQIGDNTKLILKDGDITLVADTVNLNLTDLHVSGTLTVEGITTLNDATTINSTLDTTGRTKLHGTRADTGA